MRDWGWPLLPGWPGSTRPLLPRPPAHARSRLPAPVPYPAGEEAFLLLLDAWRADSPRVRDAVWAHYNHVLRPEAPDYRAFMVSVVGLDKLVAVTQAARVAAAARAAQQQQAAAQQAAAAAAAARQAAAQQAAAAAQQAQQQQQARAAAAAAQQQQQAALQRQEPAAVVPCLAPAAAPASPGRSIA
jgi:hypothetical protein